MNTYTMHDDAITATHRELSRLRVEADVDLVDKVLRAGDVRLLDCCRQCEHMHNNIG